MNLRVWIRTLRTNTRGTANAPPAPTNLKYSDYLVGASIVSGTVAAAFGGSGVVGIVSVHMALEVSFFGGLLTTVFVGLSQWLQSKGD